MPQLTDIAPDVEDDLAQSPWKPCDLRGVFPSPVSEDLFDRIGRAIGSEIAHGSYVLVGGDFRLSTPALKAALIRGLASTGLRVVDAGQAPTPIFYFQASRINVAAVFIVTASHNPAAHNGLKWMVGNLPPSPEDIVRIAAAAESRLFRATAGSIESIDPLPAYREWILSQWPGLSATNTGRIVIDAGNGAWSNLAPAIFRELGFDVECLFCEPDGNFPNRSPDCARTASLQSLRATVVSSNARLGIAWDGDGDRAAFIDETGAHATTDEISLLFAQHFLGSEAQPAITETVVCDIKLSDSVRREVQRLGGVPLLERSGHAFMRARILTNKAILGLDACGHYFFRQAGSRDDGLYSALTLIALLNGRSLAELRKSLTPIFSTPELRIPTSVLNFDTVRARLQSAFPHAEESTIDGARLVLDQGVILARPSSTESVVSLRIEGVTAPAYRILLDQVLTTLPEATALLQRQLPV